MSQQLSDRDKAILKMEDRDWRTAARKEDVVMRELGLSPWQYYQILNALVKTELALAYSPMLVGRMRRAQAQRSRPAP